MAAKKQASVAVTSLDKFDAQTAGKHDPGQIIILFDNRHIKPKAEDNKMSTYQSYYLGGLSKMGWSTYWEKPNLDPGYIELIWYTHAGAQGTRTYPLHRAMLVKEMFDSLSDEGFRPMILGWSGENPYPMIGGTEPPPEPKKPKMQVAKSASATVSGHGGAKGATPHERVMAIIDREEEREAKGRREVVEREKKAEALGYGV